MASADDVSEYTFLSQVERVRSEIRTKFIRTHKILQDREDVLLAELQRLVDEYIGDGITQQIRRLSVSKDALKDTLTENKNKEILDESLAPIDARIKELKTKLQREKDTYKSVSLEWDDELEKKLSVAGDIRLNTVRKVMTDTEMGDYIVTFGKHNEQGFSPNAFMYPNGIAINPENSFIYICDGGNNRVQVYNKSFEFVFQFSEKMNTPYGICIKQSLVYVTQYGSHCLNVYSTKGEYLISVGRIGNNILEFDGPRGLDVSTVHNRIYIAEFRNARVQCLDSNLQFTSLISDIYFAKDVKLTSNEVVVLSRLNPCVSLFTYSHQLIREMIPCGEGNPIVVPCHFILDNSLNILITDYDSHCVCIFSFGGDLIHRFGSKGEKRGDFMKPTGITIDSIGRIIVASMNPEHCIQVFDF